MIAVLCSWERAVVHRVQFLILREDYPCLMPTWRRLGFLRCPAELQPSWDSLLEVFLLLFRVQGLILPHRVILGDSHFLTHFLSSPNQEKNMDRTSIQTICEILV
jgi:hypothetical protein